MSADRINPVVTQKKFYKLLEFIIRSDHKFYLIVSTFLSHSAHFEGWSDGEDLRGCSASCNLSLFQV